VQEVEEVFVRSASVWELRLGGQAIRSTGEHPVFLAGRGWQALHTVRVGDLLQCDDGGWQRIDGVRDTGTWQTVYNVRVSNWHTYSWGRRPGAGRSGCIIIALQVKPPPGTAGRKLKRCSILTETKCILVGITSKLGPQQGPLPRMSQATLATIRIQLERRTLRVDRGHGSVQMA
jgi:hypothetical protein